ncbi:hypothetical protein RchiOBHm_Chr2g0115071 [Rosa chinensis]|uniref:Uncharacterized protein n=1 Tax=Rosa chinensis TaxID=74649 RepID=A0A2P6RQZ6_ROSCH|nr:hypothetical protein RchiOBHm_Chr2g0115071 [Rosa chinensis]
MLFQFHELPNANSIIFKNARCKVLFSINFLKLFKNLMSACLEKLALSTRSSTEAVMWLKTQEARCT